MQQIIGLNWLRSIAAFLVVLSHARPFFYVNFPALGSDVSPVIKVFYLLTSLGHQAVMVFFVLSGYLVAGSAFRSHNAGKWSWRNYLSRRLGRLWAVLVPALVLTFVLDLAGEYLLNSSFYRGGYPDYWSGPREGGQMGVGVFLGNLVYMQTILVPAFGSNGPLWSIANEFWYYILFPLAMLAMMPGRGWRSRIGDLFLFGLIAVFVGKDIFLLFPIWLLGFISWKLQNKQFSRILRDSVWIGPILIVAMVVVILGIRVFDLRGLGADYLVGVMVALSIPALQGPLFSRGAKISHHLSEMSYSLYLTHFPVLAFLAAMNGNLRGSEIATGMPLFLLWLAIVVAVAFVTWFLFERHTGRLRESIATLLGWIFNVRIRSNGS